MNKPNAYPKRRYADRFAEAPRCTYARDTVTDRTVLVSPDGEQRQTLVRLGWTELLVDVGSVLLLAPKGMEFQEIGA